MYMAVLKRNIVHVWRDHKRGRGTRLMFAITCSDKLKGMYRVL